MREATKSDSSPLQKETGPETSEKTNEFNTNMSKNDHDNPYKNMIPSWKIDLNMSHMDTKTGMSFNDMGQVGSEIFHDMSKMKFDFDKTGLRNSLGFNVRVSIFFLTRMVMGNMPSLC